MKAKPGLDASRRRNEPAAPARDQDDRRPVRPDSLGDPEAVEVRQLHVEQHDLGAGRPTASIAEAPSAASPTTSKPAAASSARRRPESGVVVDDEDRPAHPRTVAHGFHECIRACPERHRAEIRPCADVPEGRPP